MHAEAAESHHYHHHLDFTSSGVDGGDSSVIQPRARKRGAILTQCSTAAYTDSYQED